MGANEVWWAGGSFGNRRFVDYSAVFVLAFAACCQRWKRSVVFWALTATAVAWNLLLICAERTHILTLDHHVAWDWTFLRQVLALPAHPIAVVEALRGDFAGAAWFWRIALSALVVAGACAVSRVRRVKPWLAVALLFVVGANLCVAVGVSRTPRLDPNSPRALSFEKALANPEYGETLSRQNRLLWNNFYEAGFYYFSKGDLARARVFYEKARDLLPRHPSAYFYIGYIALRNGELDTAKANLEKARQLRPGHALARRALIQYYQMTLPREVPNLEGLKRLGRLLMEEGSMQDALQVLEAAVERFPEDAESRELKRETEARLLQEEKAEKPQEVRPRDQLTP